jgi:predicted secreted protein
MKKIYNLSKWIIPLLSLLLVSTVESIAQTTLATGDLSIIGFNANGADGFKFVNWVDLASGTVIKFTDNGFNNTSSSNTAANYREQEQYVVWTNSGGTIPAGTIITIQADLTTTPVTTSTNIGSITSVTNSSNGLTTSNMALTNTSGDQVFAFQGVGGTNSNNISATFTGTIIAGIGFSGSTGTASGWVTTGGINGSTSYLPSDLSGTSQIFLGPNIVAGQYTGATSGQASLAAYKALVANPANWSTVGGANTVTFTTSTGVTFTAGAPPSITSQPANSAICAGATATFSVTASNATTYQWYVSTDGGGLFNVLSNTDPYSGVTSATLTITGATAGLNGYVYRAVATGSTSPAATSSSATLTVNGAPSIINQPSASTICAGGNTTFTVSASNATGYQWQVNTGSGFSAISNGGLYSGATSATLTITGATAGLNGYLYRVVASGACAPATTSTSAALTVNSAPSITNQPSVSMICAGGNTTFTVSASNATGYQWQVNTGSGFSTISNGGLYSGAASATLTITGATAGLNGYLYRVVTSGACTPAATSTGAALTVNSAPVISNQPTTSTICAGATATFAVTASNATGYQWQVNQGAGFSDISNGAPYSGATTATLTITGATAGLSGYVYRAVVTGACTPAATSTGAALTVNSAPVISNQPTTSTICAGATATFAVTASNATGYQWQVNQGAGFSDISNGAPYSGATTATLTITGATAGLNGYLYRAVVTGACTPAATSTGAALTVNSAPVISNQPTTSTICAGATATFSVTASNATGYQWQVNQGAGFADISNGAPYSGATTATLTITGATAELNGYVYRAVVTGACTPAATSTGAALAIGSIAAISNQPSVSTICAGANTTFSVTASNATGYQWQVNQGAGFSDISNGAPYSGATTATLTITGATAGLSGYVYRVVVTGACTPAATSTGAALTVNAVPTISNQPSVSTICAGANTTFSVTASNATGYQWQVNQGAGFSDISNGVPYSGATTATLTITGATAGLNGYVYRVIASGACTPSATSTSAALTVNAAPVFTNQPSFRTVCTGGNTTFAISASHATGYKWQVDQGTGFADISNGEPYSGATTSTLTITNATEALSGYLYRAVATGACTPDATSDDALLTVNPIPTVTATPLSAVICSGEDAVITLTSTPSGGTFSWTTTTASGTVTGASAGTNASTGINQALTGQGVQTYTITTTVNACISSSVTASINVNQPASFVNIPSPKTICAGATTTFAVTASNATGYQWQVDQGAGFTNISNGGAYSGATTATLTIDDAAESLNGYLYRVVATGVCSPDATSSSALLTVNAAPAIATQPATSTICNGSDASFSVVASGATGYQWQENQGTGFVNILNGGVYAGATTAALTITAPTNTMNGYMYRVIITGICSPDVTSNGATLSTTDLVAPVIAGCPSDISLNVSAGTCGAIATWTAPTATDNCTAATLTSDHASGDVFNTGTTLVTYTAIDVAGNTSTCSFTITVMDNETPVFTTDCPDDVTIEAGVYTYTIPVATDNCPGVLVTKIAGLGSGATFPEGTSVETYEAQDALGNSVRCSFTITATAVATDTKAGALAFVHVYPNPTSDFVYVTSNVSSGDVYSVSLQDLTGKIILQSNLNADSNFKLDVSHLSKGIYFLNIGNESNMKVEKIIVE